MPREWRKERFEAVADELGIRRKTVKAELKRAYLCDHFSDLLEVFPALQIVADDVVVSARLQAKLHDVFGAQIAITDLRAGSVKASTLGVCAASGMEVLKKAVAAHGPLVVVVEQCLKVLSRSGAFDDLAAHPEHKKALQSCPVWFAILGSGSKINYGATGYANERKLEHTLGSIATSYNREPITARVVVCGLFVPIMQDSTKQNLCFLLDDDVMEITNDKKSKGALTQEEFEAEYTTVKWRRVVFWKAGVTKEDVCRESQYVVCPFCAGRMNGASVCVSCKACYAIIQTVEYEVAG